MTASTICTLANSSGMASRDLSLMTLLCANVLPAFLHDCGYTAGGRRVHNVEVAIGEWTFPIPIYLSWVQSISPQYAPGVTTSSEQYASELRYIGESQNGQRVTAAPTESGDPDSFSISLDIADQIGGGSGRRRVWLNKILTRAITYRVVAQVGMGITGDDFTSDFEMNEVVPPEYQWGLVDGLKAELALDRWGQNDRRYTEYMNKRNVWVARAQERTEMTRQNHYVYVK